MAKANGDILGLVGSWAFLIGVVLALVVGLFFPEVDSRVQIALVVIGLIVGLLNVGASEATPFLMSGAVLIIAASLGQVATGISAIFPAYSNVLNALLLIFAPATVIVAIKNVFALARN